jgi:hypothetical protein
MAYYTFLKSLKSPEEFRKNPIIKIPHKSPPTNFQSLGIFKNPIFIPKRFFLQLSAQSAQQPAGPSGLLAQPTFFFLLLHQNRARKPPPPVGLMPPHGRPRPPPPKGKNLLCHPSFISPLNVCLLHLLIDFVTLC